MGRGKRGGGKKGATKTGPVVEPSEAPCDRPSPRSHFSLVAEEGADSAVLYGGECDNGKKVTFFSDIFRLRTDPASGTVAWSSITAASPPSPAARSTHQAAAWGGGMFVFGGESGEHENFRQHSDLWRLDLQTLSWTPKLADGGPSPRSGHRMVATGVYLVVFGGYTESKSGKMTYHNDLHIFDMIEDGWLNINGSGAQPAPRSGFLFWASLDGRHCFCSGGTGHNKKKAGYLRDLWVLDLCGMCWSCVNEINLAAPRSGMTLLARQEDLVMVFGGVTEETAPAEHKKKPQTITTFHSDTRLHGAGDDDACWADCPALTNGPGDRMHASAVVVNGWAMLYGGLCETGRGGMQEVTLDDLWATKLADTGAGWIKLMPLSDKVGQWFDESAEDDCSDSDNSDVGAEAEETPQSGNTTAEHSQ